MQGTTTFDAQSMQEPHSSPMMSPSLEFMNPRRRPRKKATADVLTVLVEIFESRPNVSTIPLGERELLGERLGKTRQQVTDFLRNRRAKEHKDAAKAGHEPQKHSAPPSRHREARPPTDDTVYEMDVSSVRIGSWSAGPRDGLAVWLNFDDNTIVYAVVSPHYYSLQLQISISLSSVTALRYESLNDEGRGKLSVYLRSGPEFSSSIYAHAFTSREEQDFTRANAAHERQHEVLLNDGETVYKQLIKSGLGPLFGLGQPQAMPMPSLEPNSPLMMPSALQSGYRFYAAAPTQAMMQNGAMLMPRAVAGVMAAMPLMQTIPRPPTYEDPTSMYKPGPDPQMNRFEALLATVRAPATDMEVSACRTGDDASQMSAPQILHSMVASH